MSVSWRQQVDVLYDADTISKRVIELGTAITEAFDGESLIVVGVMKGCFLFYADLVRAIDLPMQNDFIGISSYADGTTSSGVVQLTQDLSQPIEGAHVLLVEDIVDTGLSMRYLLDNLSTRRPASLSICTLLDKQSRRRVDVPIRYRGFDTPDAFVVGYGLDFAGLYRNLPYIGVYRESSSTPS
ncbi:MAG: hypoxanthine phosphoribosyltransferase [Myxococcota bacterium]